MCCVSIREGALNLIVKGIKSNSLFNPWNSAWSNQKIFKLHSSLENNFLSRHVLRKHPLRSPELYCQENLYSFSKNIELSRICGSDSHTVLEHVKWTALQQLHAAHSQSTLELHPEFQFSTSERERLAGG